MGKSKHPDVHELRQVYRLVGECRDLGFDCVAWRSHLFESLAEMVGSKFTIGGEGVDLFGGSGRPTHTVMAGCDGEGEQRLIREFLREHLAGGRPEIFDLDLVSGPFEELTFRRRDRAGDTRARVEAVADLERELGLGHRMMSLYHIDGPPGSDRHSGIVLQRPRGERDFNDRELMLVELLHRELGPMVYRQLAGGNEPSIQGIAPRYRKVLGCLLDGDSEKQIAGRLDLSKQTVHTYVKAIYRYFLTVMDFGAG